MTSPARLAAAVVRLIARHGQAMTLTRVAVGSTSTSGVVTPGATSTNSTRGAFAPLTSYTDNREELRTLAQRKVRYLLLSAKSMTLEPQPQDTVTVGAVNYDVESSTPISPKGTAIAHQMLVVQL